MAPDVTFESPFTGGVIKGADTIRQFLADNIFPLTKDCRVRQRIIDGQNVCIIWDFQTTSDVVVSICEHFHISDGRIASARPYFDPRPVTDP